MPRRAGAAFRGQSGAGVSARFVRDWAGLARSGASSAPPGTGRLEPHPVRAASAPQRCRPRGASRRQRPAPAGGCESSDVDERRDACSAADPHRRPIYPRNGGGRYPAQGRAQRRTAGRQKDRAVAAALTHPFLAPRSCLPPVECCHGPSPNTQDPVPGGELRAAAPGLIWPWRPGGEARILIEEAAGHLWLARKAAEIDAGAGLPDGFGPDRGRIGRRAPQPHGDQLHQGPFV